MKKANKDRKTKIEVRFREETSIIPPYEPAQVKDSKDGGETGVASGGGRGEIWEGDGQGERGREKQKGKVTLPMGEAKLYLEMQRAEKRGPILVKLVSSVRKMDPVMSGGRSNPGTDSRPVGDTNQTREVNKTQAMSPARAANRSRGDIDMNRDIGNRNRDAREREDAEKRGNVNRDREMERDVNPDGVLKTEFKGLVRNIVRAVLDEDDSGQDNREGNDARREVIKRGKKADNDNCSVM